MEQDNMPTSAPADAPSLQAKPPVMTPAETPVEEPVVETSEELPMEEMPMISSGNQKSDKGLKIVAVIACLVAIFGIGFGVYGMMQGPKSGTPAPNNQSSDNGGSTTPKPNDADKKTEDIFANGDAEVRDLIDQLSAVVDEYVGSAHFVRTFNEFLPSWKVGDSDVVVNLEKSYGLDSGIWLHNKAIEDKVFSVYEVVGTFLKDNGYTNAAIDSIHSITYYNSEKQIVCEVEDSTEPWSVGCAKTSWVTEESKKLAADLAEASGVKSLHLETVKIEDSSVAPYQRLTVPGDSAILLFYRANPEVSWQFLTGTQSDVACDKFNDDAKKAYAGYSCWDSETNSTREL